nr:FAD-dependent oxidoreductase [Xenophilus sp. Marseille-Q4582]
MNREPLRIEHAPERLPATRLECDLCIVGAGAAGVSAAVEASRLGLRVCLIDGLPQLGGQSVNGLIGTLCGFYSADAQPHLLHYGFARELLAELDAAGALSYRRARGTLIALYDEGELAAAYARHLRRADVRLVLGALLTRVERSGRRIERVHVQTRYGAVAVTAGCFLDASGDAALARAAGLRTQSAAQPVFGTTMFSLAGLGPALPAREAVEQRLAEVAEQYGLDRRDGFVFAFPGRDLCLVNLMHVETPLEPLAMSRLARDGREEVDRILAFLRAEFPAAFHGARVHSVGQPGVRQTRGIVGRSRLTTRAVRDGTRAPDAVARSAWPIEFHGELRGVHWETFRAGHLCWVPLSSMVAADADNLLAAGRCIDAEPYALAAVRVIGPCIAMGAAAAAAAATGGSALHALDTARVQALVQDNLQRCEPGPIPQRPLPPPPTRSLHACLFRDRTRRRGRPQPGRIRTGGRPARRGRRRPLPRARQRLPSDRGRLGAQAPGDRRIPQHRGDRALLPLRTQPAAQAQAPGRHRRKTGPGHRDPGPGRAGARIAQGPGNRCQRCRHLGLSARAGAGPARGRCKTCPWR